MQGYQTDDTICALSTPSGVGAIGVIRASGETAISLTNEVFSGKDLNSVKPNTLHFGRIEDSGEIYDEVVVAIFHGPHSYTGENTVEISCHGSPFILERVLKLLVSKGMRLAKEGEFTLRAFLNGKLDLSQAEAVADLIAADSEASKNLAISQLRGGYAKRLSKLRDELIHFASMLELELDFSEEDVEFANRKELYQLIENLLKDLGVMINSFDQGNALKNGVPVAIIGEPNVGKSTLLNQLLREDRAIVTDIAGTTRDVIEEVVNINGVSFRFIDTAGLRDTDDIVESIGIKKAREKAESARVVLRMIDGSEAGNRVIGESGNRNGDSGIRTLGDSKNESRTADHAPGTQNSGQTALTIVNKVDLMSEAELKKLKNQLDEGSTIFISAKNDEGIENLLRRLTSLVESTEAGAVMVSNVRHLEALKQCSEALQRSLAGLDSGQSSELVAMDIRQSMHYLGEITGDVTTDDLLGNIFSRFCIGK